MWCTADHIVILILGSNVKWTARGGLTDSRPLFSAAGAESFPMKFDRMAEKRRRVRHETTTADHHESGKLRSAGERRTEPIPEHCEQNLVCVVNDEWFCRVKVGEVLGNELKVGQGNITIASRGVLLDDNEAQQSVSEFQ